MVNINIHVESNIIEHVEDIHLMLGHMIVKTIKEQVQPEANIKTSIAQVPAEVLVTKVLHP
jgi:hypothetical protein